MSLTDLDVKELRRTAEYFGSDLEGVRGKLNIVQKLEDDGVDFTMYKEWTDREKALEPAPEVHDLGEFVPEPPKADGPTVLVRMVRENGAYDTFGFTFTREHPFCVVPEEVAEQILENEEGFRIALAKELESFYS
jgi:hypothetical protein